MPRNSKEKESIVVSEDTKKIKKTEKRTATSNIKKQAVKKEVASKKNSNENSKKKSASTNKSTATKKINKSTTEKKVVAKKETTKKKTTKSTATKKSKTSPSTKKQIEVLEYYDLPYRYNQTTVKLLAQTPNSLFVYWDISDDDKNEFIKKYGENFFIETKPVLLIHNETMNYTFEVEINDFANCWYLHVNDAKCSYKIELGRKYKNYKKVDESSDYIYISSSNEMDAPNDHILFNILNNSVYFKNVKTNKREKRNISSIFSIQNIEKIYNIYDLYEKIYPEENIQNYDFKNPSSTCTSSSFKI